MGHNAINQYVGLGQWKLGAVGYIKINSVFRIYNEFLGCLSYDVIEVRCCSETAGSSDTG